MGERQSCQVLSAMHLLSRHRVFSYPWSSSSFSFLSFLILCLHPPFLSYLFLSLVFTSFSFLSFLILGLHPPFLSYLFLSLVFILLFFLIFSYPLQLLCAPLS